MTIHPSLIQRMIDLARARAPQEACGVLWFNANGEAVGLVEAANVSPTPEETFAMDPVSVSLLTFLKRDLALWHSHPKSRAVPSLDDGTLMRQTDLPMVIVSLKGQNPDVRGYRLDDHDRWVQVFRALQTDQTVLGRDGLTV